MKNEKFELHTESFQDGFIYEWRFGAGKIQSEHRYIRTDPNV